MLNSIKTNTIIYSRISVLTLLIALFFITSCGEDDNEDVIPNNTIRYDGKNYKMDFAFGLNYGAFQEGAITYNNTDFVFLDRVIDPDDNDPVYEYGFYLEMFSAGNQIFQSGDFTYYSGAGVMPSGSFFSEGTLFFYDDNADPVLVNGGTINLSIEGSDYTFTFNMTTEDGKKIEGNFSGVIEILNIGEPNISGNITVGNVNLNADFGEIIDYGSTGTHYNYDFYIYDLDETYSLYFEAFSLGSTSFQAGTFTYGTTGTNYFDIVEYIDNETFTTLYAVSGSVVVTKLSGSREYRLQFNVVLDDESTLVGTVEGDFSYLNIGGRMGRTRLAKSSEYFDVKKSTMKRISKK